MLASVFLLGKQEIGKCVLDSRFRGNDTPQPPLPFAGEAGGAKGTAG